MNQPQKREGFVTDSATAGEVFNASHAIEPARQEPNELSPEETAHALAIDEWPIKVKLLHRPIRDNKGDEVRELVFREPTGGDINRYGNPVRIDQNGDVIIDEKKMTLIMAALTGILSPLLERMDPRDWNSCAYRLRSFFLPNPAAW